MASTGLLELRGTLDLAQFWPSGGADADTSKVRVTVGDGSFRFRKNPGSNCRVTRVFEGAKVKGRGTFEVVNAKGLVTVRLQGIDAPELHYRPSAELKAAQRTSEQHELYLKWNLEYRQPLAESATIALAEFLKSAGRDPLPCVVRSFVDAPNEVFDTYGRFVGEIFVTIEGQEISVNHWAVEQGLAVPAFYNSMSENEIVTLIAATNTAYEARRGVWAFEADNVGKFDFKRVFRGKGAKVQGDEGLVVMPKIYRRFAAWAVNKRAKMTAGSFTRYLASKKDDVCFDTENYLDQGPAADSLHLSDFVNGDGAILAWPEQLVFKEAASTLIVPGGGMPRW